MVGRGIDLDLAKEFLAKAKSDMESADILLDNGKYEDAAYHFQQSAEKAVKSLLIIHKKFESTHMVSPIFEKIRESEGLTEEVTIAIKDLEKHWLITRYPLKSGKDIWSPVNRYTKTDASDASKKARLVFDKISRVLDEKYNVKV